MLGIMAGMVSFDPLYLTVTCSEVLPFFWKLTSGWFPYSALLGWTVDTCVRQSYVVVFLASCDAPRVCVPLLVGLSSPTTVAVHGWFCWGRCTSRCILFSRRQAQDLAVTCTVLVLPEVYRFMDCSGR